VRANWWQESIRIGLMRQDVQNMAAFMQAQFIMAVQYDPQQRWQVVISPERNSLTLVHYRPVYEGSTVVYQQVENPQ